MEKQNPKAEIQSALADFDKATRRAVIISDSNLGQVRTGRQKRALMVFAKLIAHNMVIGLCVDKFFQAPADVAHFDHYSIAALARASIDACLMTQYISEITLDVDSWNLRRKVLFLHDLANRKRFLGAAGKVNNSDEFPFYENYEMTRDILKSEIETYAKRLNFDDDEIEELKKGQKVFVSGSRGAAKEAGWNVDQYDFWQSYLSAYVHSHPVSFLRADEQAISFNKPGEFQLSFVTSILGVVASCTSGSCERMEIFTNSYASDPLGQVD